MTTSSELKELEARSQRYWTIDGIPKLVMGLVWLVWGGALLLLDSLKPGLWAALLSMAIPTVLVLSGLGSRWFIGRIKERITYPRTGYVAFGKPPRRTRVLAAAVALALAIAFATLKLGWSSLNWLFLWLGLAAIVLGAWRLRRYLAAHPRESRA